MALSLVTAPAKLPVTLAEFRQHLWNIYDDQNADDLMTSLLTDATAKAEADLGRKLISQTWRLTWNPSAGAQVVLPFGGFQEVTACTYWDGSAWVAVDLASVTVDDTEVCASVSVEWSADGITRARIEWVCGYGDEPASVPGDITMAIKQLAAHWYRVRSASSLESEDGTVSIAPLTFTNLLHNHRLNLIG